MESKKYAVVKAGKVFVVSDDVLHVDKLDSDPLNAIEKDNTPKEKENNEDIGKRIARLEKMVKKLIEHTEAKSELSEILDSLNKIENQGTSAGCTKRADPEAPPKL